MRVSMRGPAAAAAADAGTRPIPGFRFRVWVGVAAALVFVLVVAAHIALDRGWLEWSAAVPIALRAFAASAALVVGLVQVAAYLGRRQAIPLIIGTTLAGAGLLGVARVVVSLVAIEAERVELFDISIRTGWAHDMTFALLLLLGLTIVVRSDRSDAAASRHRLYVALAIALVAAASIGPWHPAFPGGVQAGAVLARPAAAWSIAAHLLLLAVMVRRTDLHATIEGRWIGFAVYIALVNQLLVTPFWPAGAEAVASALGSVMHLLVYAVAATGTLIGIAVANRFQLEAELRSRQHERERARVEVALARQAARLQHANEELNQYAYIASHDLQEPLRMVSNYLQLIERRYNEVLDDDGREFIRYAVDGAVRMKQLTNDLLTYSRIGMRPLDLRMTEAGDAFAAACKNLEVAIHETGAEVIADPLPALAVDPLQLVQVFQNLLGNALKFRREGVPPRVHVSAREEADAWQVSVADNGIGIDVRYHDKVFIVFQRLQGGDDSTGSGIGLALCRKIVERHGGRIWFESELGRGTTFRFTVPTERSRRAAAQEGTEDSEIERSVSSLIDRARELI